MLALKISQHCARGSFLRSLHQMGSGMLSREIQKVQQLPDELGQSIKSATDTLDLFDALAQHDNVMNSELVMQSLKTLFNLQKSGNSTLQTSQIANHPQFEKLCRNLRKTARSLEPNEIIQALKVLSYIGIPANSNIMYILLNMLRQKVNDLSLGHIMFLEFLLKKLQKTPIVEALQIALPMLFQIQLSSQIDHENVPELVEMLMFSVNNKISDKCTMSIISALTLHGENLKVDEAASIVWSLSQITNYKATYNRLLQNSFNVVKANMIDLSFERIDTLLHKIISKYLLKFDAFYDEGLLNVIAKHVVQQDVGFSTAFNVVKKFNRINFVNFPLLDYIVEKILEDPTNIASARPAVFVSFVTAFSIANYIPKQWDTIKPHLLQNPVIQSNANEFPWMKLSLELLSLGCYSEELIDKVFDSNFLDQHLAREQNFLDYIQMLALYQCTQTTHAQYSGKLPNRQFIDKAIECTFERRQFPLKTFLETIFGGEKYVATKIVTRLGHLIDHVIIFDKDQRPVAVNNGETLDSTTSTPSPATMLEDLNVGRNKVIAILSCPKSHYTLNKPTLKGIFQIRIQSLELLRVSVVPINLQLWTELPEYERLPYLEREIKFAANP